MSAATGDGSMPDATPTADAKPTAGATSIVESPVAAQRWLLQRMDEPPLRVGDGQRLRLAAQVIADLIPGSSADGLIARIAPSLGAASDLRPGAARELCGRPALATERDRAQWAADLIALGQANGVWDDERCAGMAAIAAQALTQHLADQPPVADHGTMRPMPSTTDGLFAEIDAAWLRRGAPVAIAYAPGLTMVADHEDDRLSFLMAQARFAQPDAEAVRAMALAGMGVRVALATDRPATAAMAKLSERLGFAARWLTLAGIIGALDEARNQAAMMTAVDRYLLAAEGDALAPQATRPFPRTTRRHRRLIHQVLHLKIAIRHIHPAVVREVAVFSDITLDGLHLVIQALFGWSGEHLHAFRVPGRYGRLWQPPRSVGDRHDWPDRGESTHACTLAEALVTGPLAVAAAGHPARRNRLIYEYDFGDGWEHVISARNRPLPADPAKPTPYLIRAARACPPENCGGPAGYDELLAILGDAHHPQHAERMARVGEGFAAEDAGEAAIEAALRRLRSGEIGQPSHPR